MKLHFLLGVLVAFCLMIGLASATDRYCDSCTNCTAQITASSDGDWIHLTQNITSSSNPCISIGEVKGRVHFDCDGYTIVNNDSIDLISVGIFSSISVYNCTVLSTATYAQVYGSAGDLYVSYFINNIFAGFDNTGDAINVNGDAWFEGNEIYGFRGGFKTGSGCVANVTNNYFHNFSRYAITSDSVMYAYNNVFEECGKESISRGAIYQPASSTLYVYDNVFVNNPYNFLRALGGTGYYWNNYIDNSTWLESGSPTVIFNMSREYAPPNIIGEGFKGGNYWADYSGADTDGDGIGDTPFLVDYYFPYNHYDYLPIVNDTLLVISASSPSPVNQTELDDRTIQVNVSSIEPLSSCNITIGASTASMTVADSYATAGVTFTQGGIANIDIECEDNYGNSDVLTLQYDILPTVFEEAGSGLSGFLTAITDPVVDIILALGIITGVLMVFYGIGSAIKRGISGAVQSS